MRSHKVCQIFLLSDGEVDNTDEVLSSVSVHKNRYRIFTVGIGSEADAELIEGLAEISNGTSQFDSGHSDLSEIVINQLTNALSFAVTEIEIHFEGVDNFEITPFQIHLLFYLFKISTPT
jgi:hypothetical protein